jgi:hypothetical protein
MHRKEQAFCSKQSAFLQVEDELCAYVMGLRKSGYAVSTEML